jgi:hypothetical protein
MKKEDAQPMEEATKTTLPKPTTYTMNTHLDEDGQHRFSKWQDVRQHFKAWQSGFEQQNLFDDQDHEDLQLTWISLVEKNLKNKLKEIHFSNQNEKKSPTTKTEWRRTFHKLKLGGTEEEDCEEGCVKGC